MQTCSPSTVAMSVDVTSIDIAPTDLIDSIVVVATTTSPACSGREWPKLCWPCTTIDNPRPRPGSLLASSAARMLITTANVGGAITSG